MDYIFVAALITVVLAGIIWKFVLGLPFIRGYGMFQRRKEFIDLFSSEKVPKPKKEVLILDQGFRDLRAITAWLAHQEVIEDGVTINLITTPKRTIGAGFITILIQKKYAEVRSLEIPGSISFIIIDEHWAYIEEKGEKGLVVGSLFSGPATHFKSKFKDYWNRAEPVGIINI